MDDWKIESALYKGRTVTKITIGSGNTFGLNVSPLGIYAETQGATNLVLYATYVEGTVHGITSGWADNDIPSDALELLLPPKNAIQENVILRVLHLEAESAWLKGVVIRSPCHTQPLVITQPNNSTAGLGFARVSYECPQGETADVTKITVKRIEGPISVAWKNWEQKAGATVQKNVLVYSSFTRGSSYGITASWRGDQEPPSLALPEPYTLFDVEVWPVYIEATEIDLTGLKMKVSD